VTRSRALRATAVGSAVLVVTALIIVLVLAISYIRRPLPDRGGEVSLPGLKGKVTVLRDDRAVPQIYAQDPTDLFRVQGYVNAQDRFFEMDLRRHITAGRLSELVGVNKDALKADRVVRTLGWRPVAEREFAALKPETRNYLQAYADGVNDYVRGRSPSKLSLSYTVLARKNPLQPIEAWTPVDSLAWFKAMAWDLRSNYNEELERATAVGQVRDIDRVEQLYPSYPFDTHRPIITGSNGASASLVPSAAAARTGGSTRTAAAPRAGSVAGGSSRDPDGVRRALESEAAQDVFSAAQEAMNAIPNLLGSTEGTGSNSWVVGGELTASGLPLLANDPHLSVSIPGVWTQVGLHCTTVSEACPFDVAGFGFAGVPGVVIGHNADISWGLTNEYPDVTDFYLERVEGDTVLKDGAYLPLTTRTEQIQVAGSRPVPITVRSTSHGPLISDVIDDVARAGTTSPVAGEKLERDTSYAVSLAWTALQPGHAMDAVMDVAVAKDFPTFRKAAQELDAPAQNLIYADVAGHIGYQAPGRIPVRGPGRDDSPVPSDGTWPHPGWDSAYDWTGTIPKGDLPWVEDPADGFIVAANQAIARSGTASKMTSDWDYGYRAQRIRDLLEKAKQSQHPLTVADMRVIQGDTRNGIAELLVPLLLKVAERDDDKPLTPDEKFTQDAVGLLKDWDYEQPTDSAAAAYFNVVWSTILELTFADELPDGFKPDGGDRWFEVVRTLLSHQRDPWWDDRGTSDVVESRDEVLRRSLASARLELTTKLGKDPNRWEWGRLHRVRLEQTPLGGSDVPGIVRRLFDRGPYPAPGGSSIVDAFSWDASADNFDVTAAPSMRMIVDLSALDGSRWVNQTGISGHPGDAHYDDQIGAWLKGEDYSWPFTEKAVRAAAGDKQTFTPGPQG
jgi:penicillin G amidase